MRSGGGGPAPAPSGSLPPESRPTGSPGGGWARRAGTPRSKQCPGGPPSLSPLRPGSERDKGVCDKAVPSCVPVTPRMPGEGRVGL